MALFQKLTKKVAGSVKDTVKETVREETHKTTEELKSDIIGKVKEYLPQIATLACGLILLYAARRPVPVVVKVVVKQV